VAGSCEWMPAPTSRVRVLRQPLCFTGVHFVHVVKSHHFRLARLCLSGHVGSDGRLYVLDTARVMPAEAPFALEADSDDDPSDAASSSASRDGAAKPLRWPSAAKCAHLIYQLRPKVVLQHPTALSSDAWSRFGAHDAAILNADVAAATAHLLRVVVPAFARSLCDRNPFASRQRSSDGGGAGHGLEAAGVAGTASGGRAVEDDVVPRLLHEAGINLRYMGLVYQLLHAKRPATAAAKAAAVAATMAAAATTTAAVAAAGGEGAPDEAGSWVGGGVNYAAAWQELLLEEMVSRVVKHRVRRRCLSIRNDRALSAEHEFRGAIIHEMNKVLSKVASARTALWHPLHGFQRELSEKFGFFEHRQVRPSAPIFSYLPSHGGRRASSPCCLSSRFVG